MQGRVFSLLISVSQGLAPLGLIVAGPFADAYGVSLWYVFTGVSILLMGTAGLLTPSIRLIEDRSAEKALR